MKFLTTSILTLAVALLSASPAYAEDFTVDTSHSSVSFAVTHMMVSKVRGELGAVSGTLSYDPAKIEATTLELTVDVTEISTRNQKRDAHLRGDDFFAVDKFPNATFKSTKVKRKGKNKLAITGDLTIRGAKKQVTVFATISDEVKGPWGAFRRGASAELKINRKDFGVNWSKAMDRGGAVVSDDVTLFVDLEIKRPALKNNG